jgi:hypothetical protein
MADRTWRMGVLVEQRDRWTTQRRALGRVSFSEANFSSLKLASSLAVATNFLKALPHLTFPL